ncbi:UbiA prenyltransferase family protein [Candidatus Woesebacteria bacterium]|nr:MAG: UbiA prenyltransferase family protein [Candidatus Woesebacteria bacterium]
MKSKNLSLIKLIIGSIKVARPLHWIKNFSLFAALIFSGGLFNPVLFATAFWGFVSFNFAASATYIFNDFRDIKHDKLHPIKKNRPLAAGTIPVNIALLEMLFFVLLSINVAVNFVNPLFTTAVISYFLLQFFYSLILKNWPTIDILVIALGFIIRVYAGAIAVDAHLSVWFLLCVISVALFLASGKRRSELNILNTTKIVTRNSLSKYKRELLNSYVTMFGNAAWMSWALFTFFESPEAPMPVWLFLAEISRTTTISKLMMITIPVVIFAIMRYQSLIFAGKSEAPELVLLKDKPLVLSIVIWISLVVWVIYYSSTALIT